MEEKVVMSCTVWFGHVNYTVQGGPNFEFVDQILVVLFILLYKVVLTFEYVG